MRTKKPKLGGRIVLNPGSVLSNVQLDGCLVIMKGEGSVIKECHFRSAPGWPSVELKPTGKVGLKFKRRG